MNCSTMNPNAFAGATTGTPTTAPSPFSAGATPSVNFPFTFGAFNPFGAFNAFNPTGFFGSPFNTIPGWPFAANVGAGINPFTTGNPFTFNPFTFNPFTFIPFTNSNPFTTTNGFNPGVTTMNSGSFFGFNPLTSNGHHPFTAYNPFWSNPTNTYVPFPTNFNPFISGGVNPFFGGFNPMNGAFQAGFNPFLWFAPMNPTGQSTMPNTGVTGNTVLNGNGMNLRAA